MTELKQFILTKKIAKHGRQAIIVLPKILEGKLPPQTLVKVTIDVLEDAPKVAASESLVSQYQIVSIAPKMKPLRGDRV